MPLVGALLAVLTADRTFAAPRVNPLAAATAEGQPVESCADPSVIRSLAPGDTAWYMYCTSDPLGDWDRGPGGGFRYRYLPVLRSTDLVHWTYVGDAVSSPPSWAESAANLWAPEIRYADGIYFLYYAVTDVRRSVSGEFLCGSDSAIGVATSTQPEGPFVHAGSPVVGPRRAGPGCDFLTTIDPEVTEDGAGQAWIYYGGFRGGIEVRTLSANGLSSEPSSAVLVAAPERFEAPEVVQRDGRYTLFLSASTCCAGPASGYSVVAGQSASPAGPFLDRDAAPLDAARAGGENVLAGNGNRWIGPGHNTVLQDLAGQWWTIYHAIDEADPYFEGAPGFTRRPAMIDPLDWDGGWPIVRGGWWSSDCEQPSPVAIEGGVPEYTPTLRVHDAPGAAVVDRSDEFGGAGLGPAWSWIRPPSSGWAVEEGVLRWETQGAELYEDDNSASVLVEPAPEGDWLVETRVELSVPASGCCHDYAQAGLVVYATDDNYLKLVHVAIGTVRVTEWAREVSPAPAGVPRYGKGWVGPPADWTWLRISRRGTFGGAIYSAYTSRDGVHWARGGSWRHDLGETPRIGLVSMNRAGYTARFDYVRVWQLAPDPCTDPRVFDPCDRDGDGTGDLCDRDDDGDGIDDSADCAPQEPSAGTPPEIAGVVLSDGVPARLHWQPAPSAEFYDVTRGELGYLSGEALGPCFADDLPATEIADAETPPPGDGFAYLVRGVDAGCGGPGGYGFDSAGAPRSNLDPGACP